MLFNFFRFGYPVYIAKRIAEELADTITDKHKLAVHMVIFLRYVADETEACRAHSTTG